MADRTFWGLLRRTWSGSRASRDRGPLASLRLTYISYGKCAALIDLELGIPFGEALTLAVGGDNVLNTYPDVNQYGAATVGNQYGQFSPFGFNGAYYYTRLHVGWGGR